MSPRLTDWSLALAGGLAFATGVWSLFSGAPGQWAVFAFHGAAGLWLLALLYGKLRRVWPRIVRPRRWDRRTLYGLLALVVVTLAGGTGVYWVAGGDGALAGYNALNWHIVLGFGLTGAIALHMRSRAKRLRMRDVRGRRQAIQFGLLAMGAAALWPAQQALQAAVNLPGARRRFTGSREAESFQGNVFPTSSWVADAPRPIDAATWRLRVGGVVARPFALGYAEVDTAGDELTATLDCTGGFYSAQRWRGMRVGRLLERAGPLADVGWVRFVSVTGYRWSLPLAEARDALVATRVGDEALAHAHGAPLRLVAPGRRGFEWVKWIVAVEALTAPDLGQILAIHWSSLTPAGRGE
jgi:hypothetical protein